MLCAPPLQRARRVSTLIRSAASKAMWVGRTAAAVFGLALVLALVFGIASTALGDNGDNFILGTFNKATAITRLEGNVAGGPGLLVYNPNTAAGSRGLQINVSQGKTPIQINGTTAKATNLNSDMLDGKDSTAFLGANEKATDADKIDGVDSSQLTAYKRTVVVSPVGTDTENGTALLNALSGITDASPIKPYLLYIEAGTYSIGGATLLMKPSVDIQGAGELRTFIVGSRSDTYCNINAATVAAHGMSGAENVELRHLTVRNTGTGSCSTAIANVGASPHLTQVTAEATGRWGDDHIGVFNQGSGTSPIMTNVTATASGWTLNYGVVNSERSSPTMTNVTATAAGGTKNYGVSNNSSSSTITHSRLSGANGSLVAQTGTSIAKVALTQLVGPIVRSPFTSDDVWCFNNYDEDLQPFTEGCSNR